VEREEREIEYQIICDVKRKEERQVRKVLFEIKLTVVDRS
jgi:hypothetical protein